MGLEHCKKVNRNPYIVSAHNYLTSAIHTAKLTGDQNGHFRKLCEHVEKELKFAKDAYG